jgi:hypothetical protein
MCLAYNIHLFFRVVTQNGRSQAPCRESQCASDCNVTRSPNAPAAPAHPRALSHLACHSAYIPPPNPNQHTHTHRTRNGQRGLGRLGHGGLPLWTRSHCAAFTLSQQLCVTLSPLCVSLCHIRSCPPVMLPCANSATRHPRGGTQCASNAY